MARQDKRFEYEALSEFFLAVVVLGRFLGFAELGSKGVLNLLISEHVKQSRLRSSDRRLSFDRPPNTAPKTERLGSTVSGL